MLIDPGKLWQTGTNDSVNGKFRDKCLAMEWVSNRLEPKFLIEDLRRYYNEVRPHSSLNSERPAEFNRRKKKES